MRLKRLSILGFKSFGRVDEISLSEGFSCIVGSNGCGKSNLIDAIRWVCGETRPSTLRVKDFKELIFQGAKSQKPMGLAQVSCVLSFKTTFRDQVFRSRPGDYENLIQKFAGLLDCSEVEVTRRLFSDGDQEYLINNIPVRIKDIKDLMRALGLTFRSCSTIGQGEIDKIVELKPAELKGYMEDSCGLSELVEKLKDAKFKISIAEEDLKKLYQEKEQLQNKFNSLKRTISRYQRAKQAHEELKKLIKMKKDILDAQRSTQIGQLDQELEELEQQRKLIFEQVENLENSMKQLQRELSELNNLSDDLSSCSVFEELKKIRAKYEDLHKRRELKIISLQDLKRQLEIESEKLKQEKTELEEKVSTSAKIQKYISAINEELLFFRELSERLNGYLKKLGEKITEISCIKESLIKEKSAIDAFLNRLTDSIKDCVNLNEIKEFDDIFSLIFPGFKGVDYLRQGDLKPGIVYLTRTDLTIQDAVKRLVDTFKDSSHSPTSFSLDKGFVRWMDFIYKVDLNDSNPIRNYKEIERLQSESERISHNLEHFEQETKRLVNAQNKIGSLRHKIELYVKIKQLEVLRLEREVNEAAINDLRVRVNQRSNLLQEFSKKVSTLTADLESIDAELSVTKEKFEQLSELAETTKSGKASERERLKENLNSSIQEILTKIIQLRESEQQIFGEIQEISRRKMQIEYEIRSEIELLMSRYNISESDLNNVFSDVSTSSYLNLMEVERQETPRGDSKDNIVDPLSCAYAGDDFRWENTLDQEIERLGKQSLAMFGFDESALSEFEEVSERLTTVSDVISDSEQSLKEMISRLNDYQAEYENLFYDFFSRVNDRFNQTVGKLFSGARGKLELDESGIYVNIQFQNKKMIGLNQLSGGEKTLISLSLLCALAFESGAPALLLDEVDAPLDDFNTARFLELIKDLKNTCQIICVTHNKLTMLSADRLLGVTLNHDGSTEVITLNVADLPLEAASA